MNRFSLGVAVAAPLMLMLPYVLYGQQTEALRYRDGDWWKVKVEVSYPGGLSRTGRCEENYSEYRVKIQQGKPKVCGITGNNEAETDCPTVEAQLLDTGPETRGFLRFPLSVGHSWTFRYLRSSPGTGRAQWVDADRKVVSWEKVKTPKGELEAFKIEGQVSGQYVETSFYSPKAKAIILFKRPTDAVDRTVTLVDFNVSE